MTESPLAAVRFARWAACAAATGLLLVATAAAQNDPITPEEPAGRALVERLREGGLVLFFRHADTSGMACDSRYRLGQRAGQRNISETGREQSRRIGETIRELEIPIDYPVLTGPVFRARDTAELAFGEDRIEVTDSLLADDYARAGGRGVGWIISEHERLFGEPPQSGSNRVLIGHRTPGLIAMGGRVSREELTEGAAIVIEPTGDGAFERLGVIAFAPVPPGVDRC